MGDFKERVIIIEVLHSEIIVGLKNVSILMRLYEPIRRLCLLFIAFSASLVSLCQTTEYEQMKQELSPSSLPLVNLTVDTTQVGGQTYAPAFIEIAVPKGESFCGRCMVRYRGSSALAFAKKSFSVKLVDDAGEDLNASLFGIRSDNSWILDAMAIDRIRMRNRVCFDIWNAMSRTPYTTKSGNRNGTEGVFVELFLNSQYHGLYCFTDKIDRKLLGLKKAKDAEDGEVLVRGLLYKGERWNELDDIYLLSYKQAPTDSIVWNSWELKYPDDIPSENTWHPLMELIDFCSDSTTDELFQKEWDKWFYPDNLAEYVVFTLAMNIGDNAYKNTYLSVVDITKDHRFLLTPWDMDMSMYGSWDGTYNDMLSDIHRYDKRAPFNRLSANNIDNFCEKVKALWYRYSENLLSPDSVSRRLDAYAQRFLESGAWERECAKWNGNPVPLKLNIEDELELVKQWYYKNHTHLCLQFGLPDSIKDVTDNSPSSSQDEVIICNLQGQRINGLQKGLNIVDGKKIWVK